MQKAAAPDDHKPIPFEDATHFKRLKSWDESNKRARGATISSRHSESMPDLVMGKPPHADPEFESPAKKLISPTTRPPLVTKHEKHPPWDDSSRLDRPYDNPYYVRPIQNHLWLPRDPIGLLDLDDTVNVFRALTSDASLGQLGEWVEEGIALADLPSSDSVDEISLELGDSDSESPPPIRRITSRSRSLSGQEEIELPPVIAERISHLERESDIDHAEEFEMHPPSAFRRPSLVPSFRRPSLTSRRSTNSDVKRESPPRTPRPNTSESRRPPPATSESQQPRPRSAGSTAAAYRASSMSPPRASSLMSSSTLIHQQNSHVFPRRRNSSAFADLALSHGVQPFAPATRSRVSFATQMGGNKPRSASGSSMPVSTREAVVGEVIAEEQQATEIRNREEAAEDRKSEAHSTRSWLTSWMYSRLPWPG